MCAVAVNRTMVHYGNKHLCLLHKCKVEKTHIDSCSHLKLDFKVTEFNDELRSQKLHQIKPDRLALLHNHFTKLKALIENLEKDLKSGFVPIEDNVKLEVM